MLEYYPLIIVVAVVCGAALACLIAYRSIKDSKKDVGFERNMKDSEITKRLLVYAKPYWKRFVLVLFLMIFSIAYDILAPTLVGEIEELVKYEIAKELGLFDRVMTNGWGSLSAKETGRIGGILAKRRKKEQQEAEESEAV